MYRKGDYLHEHAADSETCKKRTAKMISIIFKIYVGTNCGLKVFSLGLPEVNAEGSGFDSNSKTWPRCQD